MDSLSLPKHETVERLYDVASRNLLPQQTLPVISKGKRDGQPLSEPVQSQDDKERQYWTVIKAKIAKRSKQGKKTAVYRGGWRVSEKVLAEKFRKYCHEEQQAPATNDTKTNVEHSPVEADRLSQTLNEYDIDSVEGATGPDYLADADGLMSNGKNNVRPTGQPKDHCCTVSDTGEPRTASSDFERQLQRRQSINRS